MNLCHFGHALFREEHYKAILREQLDPYFRCQDNSSADYTDLLERLYCGHQPWLHYQ